MIILPGLALLASLSSAHHDPMMTYEKPPVRVAVMCMKSGEQVSGMNKICFYNCLGSQAAITISSVALCPLTIDR